MIQHFSILIGMIVALVAMFVFYYRYMLPRISPTSSGVRTKVVRAILILIPISISIGPIGLLAGPRAHLGYNLFAQGFCGGNPTIMVSPNRKFVASSQDYSCAAMDDFHLRVYVRRPGALYWLSSWFLRDDPVFACDGANAAHLTWTDTNTLLISPDGCEGKVLVQKDSALGDVNLKYEIRFGHLVQ